MNELEKSWDALKLLATRLPRRRNDKAYFQAGFNAASKLFKKSNITTDTADGDGRDKNNWTTDDELAETEGLYER